MNLVTLQCILILLKSRKGECHQLLITYNYNISFIISIVTPEQWEAYSSHNTRQANEEMGKSVRLRETINHTIQQVLLTLSKYQHKY